MLVNCAAEVTDPGSGTGGESGAGVGAWRPSAVHASFHSCLRTWVWALSAPQAAAIASTARQLGSRFPVAAACSVPTDRPVCCASSR